MTQFLDQINSPADIKELNDDELQQLAAEIRHFMIQSVSETGGHLAPSLGTVDLIVALCREYDFLKDKVIFDVGHQSYAYKIITGRKNEFHTLRQWGGISGFPKAEESPYDAFNTGHSSTSISAGLGMAFARDLKGDAFHIISVIGDGALTGGMAFEALNNAGSSQKDLTVILNDNEMSISPNVGALANYLSRVRTAPRYVKNKRELEKTLKKTKAGSRLFRGLRRLKDSFKYLVVQGIFFEELGFTYLGPIDGHDIPLMRKYLQIAKGLHGPVLLHVHTKKGKGYLPSETAPQAFHGIAPFDAESGKLKNDGTGTLTFSKSFGTHLLDMASSDERICAITAAMPDGTGLKRFAEVFPNRFFDVGIAEQHAITFAAGMAKEGFLPVVAIYSSFLQRGFDQVFHDVCLQKLPVIVGIDRSGIVGEDGETHQGIYDISFLRMLPNITIMAPSTDKEVLSMLRFAKESQSPCFLRYPRGAVGTWDCDWEHAPLTLGKGEILEEGKDILLIPLGNMMEAAIKAKGLLVAKGYSVGLFHPRFIKPLDWENLTYLGKKYKKIISIEDHVKEGGFGSEILELFNENRIKTELVCLGYPDQPMKQGEKSKIMAEFGLDSHGIVAAALKMLEESL